MAGPQSLLSPYASEEAPLTFSVQQLSATAMDQQRAGSRPQHSRAPSAAVDKQEFYKRLPPPHHRRASSVEPENARRAARREEVPATVPHLVFEASSTYRLCDVTRGGLGEGGSGAGSPRSETEHDDATIAVVTARVRRCFALVCGADDCSGGLASATDSDGTLTLTCEWMGGEVQPPAVPPPTVAGDGGEEVWTEGGLPLPPGADVITHNPLSVEVSRAAGRTAHPALAPLPLAETPSGIPGDYWPPSPFASTDGIRNPLAAAAALLGAPPAESPPVT